jgi:hypothetical protein
MSPTVFDLGSLVLLAVAVLAIGVARWMSLRKQEFQTRSGHEHDNTIWRSRLGDLLCFGKEIKKFAFFGTTAVVLVSFLLTTAASASTVITASGDPGAAPSNPFNYTNITINSNSPTYNSGSDIRDIFGGTFSTLEAPGRTIFADNPFQVSTYQISFTTSAPVSLSSISLFLTEDGGSNYRSATNFQLKAGGALIANIALAPLGQSYFSAFGSDSIKVASTFAPVTATSFQAIFTSNNGYFNGIRVFELDGQGSSATTVSSNPEPSSIHLALLGGLMLAWHIRRRAAR